MTSIQHIVTQMQCAILHKQNSDLIVEDVALPTHLSYGQVLVKLRYSGICGSQLGEISGIKGPDKYLPHLLGHEGSGEVLAVGEGVQNVQPGTKVVLHWKMGSGIESATPKYKWRNQELNAGWVTTFNEYAVVSENRLTAIPEDFPLELGALFGCAITTGFGVVCNDAKLQIGESIVVLGAGGIGLNVIQAAALHNAYPIIAVDIVEEKLELARKLGATHTIHSKREDISKMVLEHLGGLLADVVVENTGCVELIELSYELTHEKGRTVLVGVPKAGCKASIFSLPLHFGKSICGSHGGGTVPQKDIPRYLKLAQLGKIRLEEFYTDRFPLSEINEAISKMKSGQIAGRCLIEMNAGS